MKAIAIKISAVTSLIGPGIERRRCGSGGFGGLSAGAGDFGLSAGFFGSATGSGESSGALTSALIGRSALTLTHRTGAAMLRPVGYAFRKLAD
jgi:hypothetical protein